MFIHAVLHKTCITHKMCCGRNIYLQIFADKGPTEIPVGPKGRAGVGEAEYKHRRGQKVDHSGRDSNPQPPDSKSDALPLRHRSVAVFTKASILLYNDYTFSKIIGLAAHGCSTASPQDTFLLLSCRRAIATALPALDLLTYWGCLGVLLSSLHPSAFLGRSAISISPLMISQRNAKLSDIQ